MVRHGNPGEWAKVRGTMTSLWPVFLCCTALGACGASLVLGRHPAWFAAGFVAIVVATALLWRKGLRRVESYFKGARGEERVAGILEVLPDAWHVFHDFAVGRYHVDHVLVGPTGVYAVETKNWRGRVTVERSEMIVDGVLADRAPLAQAARQADAVRAALKAAGWEGEVVPALCLASDTLVDGLRSVGRTTALNASRVVEWISNRPSALAPNEVARLALLMETRL